MDDKIVEYEVQSEADCKVLLSVLERGCIKDFKLKAAFSEKYQL